MKRAPICRHLVLLPFALFAAFDVSAQFSEDPTNPRRSGLVERVERHLVLLDTVVVDRAGGTVDGLGVDDFELFVDGELRAIDTFDLICSGAGEDPRGTMRTDLRAVPAMPEGGRRIALMFDYLHLCGTQRAEVLDHAMRLVKDGGTKGDEIMVVALVGGLRVEQPFTTDTEVTLSTLKRMQYDITLWNGNFRHLGERGWVAGMTAMLDVLGAIEGRKALVLYSSMPAVMPLESEFRRLAAAAATARCPIYPVNSGGLVPGGVPGLEPWCGCADPTAFEFGEGVDSPGSATSLARLARDSGGRYTENTNDLTLGYARAQRDLGCVYTLGFYDATIEDTPRLVTINVKRPGLRALHPSAYMTRSPATRRASMLQAAFQMPGLFDRGIVRAHLFPLRPTSKKRWEGLLALSFPVRLASASEGGASTHDFGVVLARTLSTSDEVEFQFDRRISLVPTTAQEASTRLVTFVDRVELKPGTYRLSAVMIDTAQSDPQATEVTIEVPQLPPGELTVLEPVLGTRAGRDLVIFAGEDASIAESDQVGGVDSFRPLLVRRLEAPTELIALNRVCRSGKRVHAVSDAVVERAFRTVTGAELASVDPVKLQFDGKAKFDCQEIVDVVPSAALTDGDYVFEVWVSGTDIDANATRSAARLEVATSNDGGAAASTVPLPD